MQGRTILYWRRSSNEILKYNERIPTLRPPLPVPLRSRARPRANPRAGRADWFFRAGPPPAFQPLCLCRCAVDDPSGRLALCQSAGHGGRVRQKRPDDPSTCGPGLWLRGGGVGIGPSFGWESAASAVSPALRRGHRRQLWGAQRRGCGRGGPRSPTTDRRPCGDQSRRNQYWAGHRAGCRRRRAGLGHRALCRAGLLHRVQPQLPEHLGRGQSIQQRPCLGRLAPRMRCH